MICLEIYESEGRSIEFRISCVLYVRWMMLDFEGGDIFLVRIGRMKEYLVGIGRIFGFWFFFLIWGCGRR